MFKNRVKKSFGGGSFRRRGYGGNYSNRYAVMAKRFNGKKMLDSQAFVSKAVPQSEEEAYISQNSFTDFAVDSRIKKNIEIKNYKTPTPIQDQAIPAILKGLDVIGIANTGTGKTAAFLIPLIDKILKNPNEKVLIVTPTRELAQQIQEELRQFSLGLKINCVLAIGGNNIRTQKLYLKRDHEFVIGTPGRLIDLIKTWSLNLEEFNNVVLDEVDRMLDIGFIRDVKYLISKLPAKRQSLFFSATVDNAVADIVNGFVVDPVTVSVKNKSAPTSINQEVIKFTGEQDKLEKLHDLLINKEFKKVLVFGQTKWKVERLYKSLQERGFKAASIHGNKSQGQRKRTLDSFRDNKIQVLLATDVVSRGIDVEDITHVINYDVPNTIEDHIHRIGRTGRADKTGSAITFVSGYQI